LRRAKTARLLGMPGETTRGDGSGLTILVGEGVATACQGSAVTGYLAIAAFSCGNLLNVARSFRARYPKATESSFWSTSATAKAKPIEQREPLMGSWRFPDFGENLARGRARTSNVFAPGSRLEAVRACIETVLPKPAPAEPVAEAIMPSYAGRANTGFSESEAARRFGESNSGTGARFAADEGVWDYYDGTRWVKDHAGVWMLEPVAARFAGHTRRTESASGSAGSAIPVPHGRDGKTYNGLPGPQAIDRAGAAMADAEGQRSLSSQFDADPWLLNVDNGTLDLPHWQTAPPLFR